MDSPLRLLVDQNIPLAQEVLGCFGEIRLAPGREISSASIQDADALLVRSITRVDRSLLEGSRIRFVGTATIGTDHIDLEWLRQAGIAFADAAGCNACSVAEYVVAALLEIESMRQISVEGQTLGVVGVGNVGSRVVQYARNLGMKVLCCDPPRVEKEGLKDYVSLETILDQSDVVTFHTPLTREGPHPTYHLLSSDNIASLKAGAVVINTSRGSVIEGKALLDRIGNHSLGPVVLDVWEGEPKPNHQLLERVFIATPHIAGYSYDGKVAGTRMMAEALARFTGHPFTWDENWVEKPSQPVIQVDSCGRQAIREAVVGACPILEDDARMRTLLNLSGDPLGAAFDRLRKDYPIRREFGNYSIAGPVLRESDITVLRSLGFHAELSREK